MSVFETKDPLTNTNILMLRQGHLIFNGSSEELLQSKEPYILSLSEAPSCSLRSNIKKLPAKPTWPPLLISAS